MSLTHLNARHRVHEQSVFGPFCWMCGIRRQRWKFWVRWQPVADDHDEPF